MAKRRFGKVRRLTSGRWQASYIGPDGARYTAPATFQHDDEAEAWLAEVRATTRRGTWTSPKPAQAAPGVLLFGSYAVTWLDERTVGGRPLRPKTVGHYEQLLDKFILPTFAGRELGSVTPAEVRSWYTALGTTTGPTFRAHAYSLLGSIFRTALADGLVDRVPTTIRGAQKAHRASSTTLPTAADVDSLAAAMPARLAAMVHLGAWGGLRYGEATELRRRDVEVTDAGVVVHVRRAVVRVGKEFIVGDTKSDAGVRSVLLPGFLTPLIVTHLAEHTGPGAEALLFPNSTGGHLPQGSFAWHWNQARASVGRTDLRFHDLRHHALTEYARAGATLAEVMGRAGHSTVAAAIRYQHDADPKRHAELVGRMRSQA